MSHRNENNEKRYLWLRGIDFDNLMIYIRKASLDFDNPLFQWDMKGVENGVQWIYFDTLTNEEMQLLCNRLENYFKSEKDEIERLEIKDLYIEMLNQIREEFKDRQNLGK